MKVGVWLRVFAVSSFYKVSSFVSCSACLYFAFKWKALRLAFGFCDLDVFGAGQWRLLRAGQMSPDRVNNITYWHRESGLICKHVLQLRCILLLTCFVGLIMSASSAVFPSRHNSKIPFTDIAPHFMARRLIDWLIDCAIHLNEMQLYASVVDWLIVLILSYVFWCSNSGRRSGRGNVNSVWNKKLNAEDWWWFFFSFRGSVITDQPDVAAAPVGTQISRARHVLDFAYFLPWNLSCLLREAWNLVNASNLPSLSALENYTRYQSLTGGMGMGSWPVHAGLGVVEIFEGGGRLKTAALRDGILCIIIIRARNCNGAVVVELLVLRSAPVAGRPAARLAFSYCVAYLSSLGYRVLFVMQRCQECGLFVWKSVSGLANNDRGEIIRG